jgi:hypothetical protein
MTKEMDGGTVIKLFETNMIYADVVPPRVFNSGV